MYLSNCVITFCSLCYCVTQFFCLRYRCSLIAALVLFQDIKEREAYQAALAEEARIQEEEARKALVETRRQAKEEREKRRKEELERRKEEAIRRCVGYAQILWCFYFLSRMSTDHVDHSECCAGSSVAVVDVHHAQPRRA